MYKIYVYTIVYVSHFQVYSLLLYLLVLYFDYDYCTYCILYTSTEIYQTIQIKIKSDYKT